jgi:vacuolar-type H+-ATPase subunit I/STV1
MPPLTDQQTRGNVIRQWILGFPRDTIAEQNGIGAGTVSSIVANYKVGLEELDFNSIRQLAVEARQHGWNFADLASHARLYNYFIKSGAAEDKIESFIDNINSGDVSPEKVVEYVNQLFAVSSEQSVPLDQVPNYIKEKLEEKQKIDEQIKQADAILQSKNVSIEAINEHIRLKEELKKFRLSTKDIHRLVNLLEAAKEYRYSPGKIVAKLRSIKGLENKENKLKTSCDVLSKQADKYKGIIPLAQLIWDLHISKNELISFKIAVNEAVETYGLTPSAAALHVINLIKDHNKKGQLKKELSSLYLQKYAINEFCSRHSQTIMALMNLQSHGIIEEQIISLNNFLESNGYKTSSYTSTK